MNVHSYVLPQSWKRRDLFPNVEIELPFAAESELPLTLFFLSAMEAGRTLTSAPESIKKARPVSWSLAKSRLLSVLSTAEAITGDRPSRFPMVCRCMVGNNVLHSPQTSCDTSRLWAWCWHYLCSSLIWHLWSKLHWWSVDELTRRCQQP